MDELEDLLGYLLVLAEALENLLNLHILQAHTCSCVQ